MTAGLDDPELWEVFRGEMTRHVGAMQAPGAERSAWLHALHAMKGAAWMMGLGDLARALGELEDAVRRGDAEESTALLGVIERLLVAQGVAAHELGALAPPAPRGLGEIPALSPPPRRASSPAGVERDELMGYFLADARQRLEAAREHLAEAEASDRARAGESLDAALRCLHALKGSAGTLGAGAIARATHALEGAIQALASRAGGATASEYAALERARARLSVAVADVDGGDAAAGEIVRILRQGGLLRERDVPAQVTASTRPSGAGESVRALEMIRVSTTSVARLTEAFGEVGFLRARVDGGVDTVADVSRALLLGARELEDALRRIGPARPWGAPTEALDALTRLRASLREAAGRLDADAAQMRREVDALGRVAERTRELLRGVGEVTAGWVFDRVAPAVQLAAADDRRVRLVRQGEDVVIDRAVAEPLVDALSQLVRNAIAHGVARPAVRLAQSKPASAMIRLEASAEGDVVRIAVEDDGEGIDLDAVRARAEALGYLDPHRGARPEEVLEALFRPGVSTRREVDAEAGRGVGLDLVRDALRRLGGVVRATTRRGSGTRFEVEVEARPIVQRLLPVRAAGAAVMIPLSRVIEVARAEEAPEALALARLFDLAPERGRYAVRLRGRQGHRALSVRDVDPPCELVVRPLPAALDAGIWRGAAIDGAGRVVLVLDPDRMRD